MAESSAKGNIKIIVSVVLILASLAIMEFVPGPADLDPLGWKTLWMIVIAIILWCTEIVPSIISTVLIVCAFPLLGILTADEAFAACGTNGMFFILGAFGLAAIMRTLNIPKYLLKFMFKLTGNNSQRIVFGFCVLAGVISIILMNGAATAIVATFAAAMMKAAGDPEPGKSNLGRALMLGVVFAAQTGGLALPSSGICNTIALNMLNGMGYGITFIQWAVIGVPAAIILTLLVAFVMAKFTKPEPFDEEQWAAVMEYVNTDYKLGKRDYIFLVVLAFMLYFWIFTHINMAITCAVGLCVMMLPGIRLMDGKELTNSLPIASILMICAVMVIVAAVQAYGVGTWIVDVIFGDAGSWPLFAAFAMVAVAIVIMHIALPAGVAALSLSGAIFIPLCSGLGIPMAALAVLLTFGTQTQFLLPLDPIYMMTSGYGYWKFTDCVKYGVPLQIISVVIMIPLAFFIGMAFV